MTAFLVATLLSLSAAGVLTVIWRERRELFNRALAIAVGVAVLLSSYAWWVTHGHAVTGDDELVQLGDLQVTAAAGSQRVTGTVRNLSPDRTISAVPLLLQGEDCQSPGASCERVAEVERALVISVPPGEQRPFVAVFNTPAISPAGTLVFRVDHEGPRTHSASTR